MGLRHRQVHLDFHTTEHIAGVGREFDPEAFADRLARAHVNSITCFAHCHHGWLYYPSKRYPNLVHPHLERPDLMGEQIEACHARDIRVPIYFSVQGSIQATINHPEWLVISPEGRWSAGPLEAAFFRDLCLNTGYRDYLHGMITEVLEQYPVDGIFLDITRTLDCCCPTCIAAIRKSGHRPDRKADRMAYAEQMMLDWKRELSSIIRKYHPKATIFYNQGHIGPGVRPSLKHNSHLELESLPSGGWGYLHFPQSILYARTLGLECLGMTGKFLTTWGDFHSYKSVEGLTFECMRMLAYGARCSIGDQLPPPGRLDEATYDLIGHVYEQVEALEPWCEGAEPLVEVGVFTPEQFDAGQRVHPSLAGAVQMLTEAAVQFNIIDSQSDLVPYRMLILPDRIPVDNALRKKIEAFVKRGGSLIASFESGLDPLCEAFNLPCLGVEKSGEGPLDDTGRPMRGRVAGRNAFAEYLVPDPRLAPDLRRIEYVMHMNGLPIRRKKGARMLGKVVASHFDRDWERYISHMQSPSSGRMRHPGIVENGRCIYFSHAVFHQYRRNGAGWCASLVRGAVRRLLGDTLVHHDGPSSLVVTILEQRRKKRRVVHLNHYIPERRTETIDVVRDIVPLFDLQLELNAPTRVRHVRCVPQGEALAFDHKDEVLRVKVPRIDGTQLLEIGY